jgi:hypothetical protein
MEDDNEQPHRVLVCHCLGRYLRGALRLRRQRSDRVAIGSIIRPQQLRRAGVGAKNAEQNTR